MSLINKMLQDLEARGGPASENGSAIENLYAVRNTPHRKPRAAMLILTVLVVVAALGGAYYYEMKVPRSTAAAPQPMPVAPLPEVTIAAPAPVTPAAPPPAIAPPAPASVPAIAAEPEKKVALVPRPEPRAPEKKAQPPRPQVAAAPVAPSKPVPPAQPPVAENVVIEKNERPISPQEQAEAAYQQAAQLVSQGRSDEARAKLQAALASAPDHHAARELAAATALQNGRLQEAHDVLVQGLNIAPTRLSFAQLLARVHLERGDEVQAIATLEAARGAGTGNAGYLSFLAALYQRAGRHPDAVGVYREVVALRAQDARAWLGLGVSLEATQDSAGAVQSFARALQLGGLDAKLSQYAQQRVTALKKEQR